MATKQALLEQVLLDLPEGIRSHLDTAIPALVSTADPTDVDSAIIAQGKLAHNLNLIFKAFEGLTIAAIPMYIAQLNTVNQGMLIAGLEYLDDLTEDDAGVEPSFEIVEPSDGGAYLPGDVRFQVRPKQGTLQQVAVEVGDKVAALSWDKAGFFWGFVRLETEDLYLASVSGLFVDDKGTETTVAVEVGFAIDSASDDLAEGKDFGPIESAYQAFKKARLDAVTAIEQEVESVPVVNAVAAFAKKMMLASEKITDVTASVAQAVADKVTDLITANNSRSLSPGDIQVLTIIGELDNMLTTVYTQATIQYLANNPHPPTGYATSPALLSGAAAAMNEIYGAGTVYYEGM